MRWENQFKSIVGDSNLIAYADYQDAMGWYSRTDIEDPMVSVNEVDVASFFFVHRSICLKFRLGKAYMRNVMIVLGGRGGRQVTTF